MRRRAPIRTRLAPGSPPASASCRRSACIRRRITPARRSPPGRARRASVPAACAGRGIRGSFGGSFSSASGSGCTSCAKVHHEVFEPQVRVDLQAPRLFAAGEDGRLGPSVPPPRRGTLEDLGGVSCQSGLHLFLIGDRRAAGLEEVDHRRHRLRAIRRPLGHHGLVRVFECLTARQGGRRQGTGPGVPGGR